MNRGAWRIAIVAAVATAAIAGGLASFAAGRFTWGTPEIPKAQCEASITPVPLPAPGSNPPPYQAHVAAAVIREPQNTWSNLGFVFVGALVVAHDRRFFSRLLGAVLCGLGIASGLYHASLLASWRTVDVAAMGWVTFALSCVGASVVWRKTSERLARFHVLIGSVGSALAILAAVFRNDVRIGGVKPFDSTYTTIAGVSVVSLLLLAAVYHALRRSPQSRLRWGRLGLLVVTLGAAIACQLGDHPGHCFCHPESPVQAHAVWHVLMAVAVALTYDLFASIDGGGGILPQISSNTLVPDPVRVSH
jgi:hypothetical protein